MPALLPRWPLQGAAERLALARRPMAARQGTREFVRGKIGSMPFTPGQQSGETGTSASGAAPYASRWQRL